MVGRTHLLQGMGFFHHDHPPPSLGDVVGFFMQPMVLHGFSGSCHIGLLLILLLVWVFRRGDAQERRRFLHHKLTLFTSGSLGFLYFLISIFSYIWYNESDADADADIALRTISWFGVAAYLHLERKYLALLRIWWVLFLMISCSFVGLDVLNYKKFGIVDARLWILDSGSLLFGLILSCAGFFQREEEERSDLGEPLLEDSSKGIELDNLSDFSKAGFFSLLTFSWIGPLLSVGRSKVLDLKDVPTLSHRDQSISVFSVFRKKLDSYTGGGGEGGADEISTLKLAKALVFSIKGDVLWTGVLAFASTVASYAGPYLITFFIQYLNGSRRVEHEGYLLVMAFIAAKLVECLAQRHCAFGMQRAGLRLRSSIVGMIYQKGLSLSCRARQGRTSGEIVNIMSVDAGRVETFSWYLHDVWQLPLQVTLALLILYSNLGLASLAALVTTVVLTLVNIPLSKMEEGYQGKMMEFKDARMKSTSEILRNMKILKIQGWEMKFLSRIMELRNNETDWLKKYLCAGVLIRLLFLIAPITITVVTFGCCMLMGIPLESGKVLSALATFKVLQQPIYALPDIISTTIQTKVSLDRISSFLRLEDLKHDAVLKLSRGSSKIVVEVSEGTFSWDHSIESPVLKDLNFRVMQGMKVAICGTVGSGKSSLLSCILGEVPKVSGTVKLCGTTSYVAQSPWIQSGTIQDNILFSKQMDKEKYENVLEACSLKKDLDILPLGDETVIGERGINLSGGQKQRIQIARALYHDADIFLFDDPFSALDAHTGSHVFKECLLGLLASKTVVYVTHQVEFLPSADIILVIKNGRIVQAGKYDDMLRSETDFMELVGAHKDALAMVRSVEFSTYSSNSSVQVNLYDSKGSEQAQPNGEKQNDSHNGDANGIATQKGQLVQEEEREKGRVGFGVYWRYITMSYKGSLVPVVLLSQVLFQILQIISTYWMAWAVPVTKDKSAPVNGRILISVYAAFALGSSFCALIRSSVVAIVGFKTANLLFEKLHICIFRAPMSFFDSTPSGRILNRASSDQSAVDTDIPYSISSLAFSIIQLLGIIAVMSQVAWQVFLICIPVIATCIWYQQYYIDAARELTRLVGVCKAPNIQHFAESMTGSMTIRSFNEESRFIERNFHLMDNYSRPKFYYSGAMEWLCFRMDMLSSVTFAFSLIFLISMPEGLISPAIVGLAVTYGLNLNNLQAYVIWNFCNLESSIISVERMLQYMNIPSEPPLTREANKPESNWPSQGEVLLIDLQVRYAPHMPFVLRGLTCSFHGGRKTGIVGRTGSGKSTLLQALFRIIDPTVGQILIDGIDITTIGLHDLRSRLSIIPQDPTMFEGTVRSNLDPLEEYTDEEIWKALDCCQLGDEVRKNELKLNSTVTENGENWSVGQRQLVCMGRAILKRSKILVMDEATASVDTATDGLIQKTLRLQFSESTVITVAHRITSVLDSDMVLLLDNGVIMEYDTPARLLESKSSLFAKLVSEYTMRSCSSFDNLTSLG